MTNELATRNAGQQGGEIMERVIATGDLSNLTPNDRSMYYAAVCESVGLNPLTRPFEYITLNGKLTLYANKGCTDQLRSIRGVSIDITRRDRLDDLYVVTATATDPTGRRDSEIGAVNIGGLRGDALANAMMKATTKAKRRVTLSICGLGLPDESEVDSIPPERRRAFVEQQPVPDADFLQEWDEAITGRGFSQPSGRALLKAVLAKRKIGLEEADDELRRQLIEAANAGKFDKLAAGNGHNGNDSPEPPYGSPEQPQADAPADNPTADVTQQQSGSAPTTPERSSPSPAPADSGAAPTPQQDYEEWLSLCREAAMDSCVSETVLNAGINGNLAAKGLKAEPWRLPQDVRTRILGQIAEKSGLFADPKPSKRSTGAGV
jgi:hypothetical protein